MLEIRDVAEPDVSERVTEIYLPLQ